MLGGIHTRHLTRGLLGGLCAALCLPYATQAQEDAGPNFRFGLSTGFVTHSNRGLDSPRAGSTTELTTNLDFALRFATPIQELEITGNVGLRTASGADGDSLDQGIYDPNLRLSYARQSRDARFSFDLFGAQRDASSTFLQSIPDSANFELLTDDGTLLRFGFDTSLELRRRSPFGVTLSAGYTGLRYSDTTSASLTDQDRYRVGALFRFDLNPSLQATLDTGFSTFEDEGTAEGRRDTFSIDGRLRQDMRNGSASVSLRATDTEDGTRYSLSGARTIELPTWSVTGSLGVTRGVNGQTFATGALDVSHTLPNGALTANLGRTVTSGSDDEQQEIITAAAGYSTRLSEITTFNVNISYTDRSDTGLNNDSSLSTIDLGLRHVLSQDWSMNVGLQHRISEDSVGTKARDNRLSVNLRRDFSVRR